MPGNEQFLAVRVEAEIIRKKGNGDRGLEVKRRFPIVGPTPAIIDPAIRGVVDIDLCFRSRRHRQRLLIQQHNAVGERHSIEVRGCLGQDVEVDYVSGSGC